MVFSFTYSKIFSRSAFSRSFLTLERRDRALRFVAGPLALVLWLMAFGLSRLFAFEGLLLAPFLLSESPYPIPALLFLVVGFYISAWIADEQPRNARVAILWIGAIFVPVYLLFGHFSNIQAWLVRIPLILYIVTVPTVAWLQLRTLASGVEKNAA